jgi:hypothetical protein
MAIKNKEIAIIYKRYLAQKISNQSKIFDLPAYRFIFLKTEIT